MANNVSIAQKVQIDCRFLFVCAVLCLVLVYVHFLAGVQPVPLRKGMSAFPSVIGEFTAVNSQKFDEQVVAVAGMDDYLMWQFADKEGYTIGLYIGFYEDQTEGGIIHSPRHCMPGSGWEIFDLKEQPLELSTGQSYVVNRMFLQKGIDKQLAHYWYQGRGRVVANEYLDRFYMVLDSVLKKRSDGALVRITGSGNDLETATRKQVEFIESLMPILSDFLPN